ncbi:4-hydroxy-tetrahydrodipicolinate reductase [Helicobacter cynogastricus]|uniref:4-hydroxy-tetrahydrodipicolinate reductase n=1 Tax=Helicobacter cynogastricus TaxID=329937 RepID=UPI000CF0220F|nr:4-hydroxy-tetrahydrodipicolinate reductase [Helicobacter cynogastricus]
MDIGVFGASGKVGRLLIQEIKKTADLNLSSVFVRKNLTPALVQILPESAFVTNNLEQFVQHCQLVIDFSLSNALSSLLDILSQHPLPLVSGTTGLDMQSWDKLQNLAKHVPVLHTSNMSLGMAVLNKVVASVAKNLKEADIEIIETHHRYKKDAPSGSALTLGKTCAQARNLEFQEIYAPKRDAQRQEKEIGFASVRGGDVVGKHVVGFYLDGEYLELTHVVTERSIFAKGALEVARWLVSQPPGFYSIENLYAKG